MKPPHSTPADVDPDISLLPHSIGYEKSVLSLIMSHPDYLEAAGHLTGQHFYFPGHQIVFRLLTEMRAGAGDGYDLVQMVERLHASGQIEHAGGPRALYDLYTYSPGGSKAYFLTYVEGLCVHAARRMAIHMGEQLIATARTEPDPQATLDALREPATAIQQMMGGAGASSRPFTTFQACGQQEESAPLLDFVEGLLTEGGASVMYGPSNCGKTFCAMDLCVHIATGRTWRAGGEDEREVDRGGVVYFSLEGTHGFRNRIKAQRDAGHLRATDPFYICYEQVSLLEHGHTARLVDTVKACAKLTDHPIRLVVLDTLARAMAGGDENSGQDMTAAVATVDAIRRATGAHVMIIHHCGKDEARGARGHSSLRAAVDTELEVSRPEGQSISTLRATKQRDMEAGGPMPFSLVSVPIGLNHRGKPVTSCLVKHEDPMMAPQPKKPGRKNHYTAKDLLGYLPADSITAWQRAAEQGCGISNGKFYDLKRELEQNDLFLFEPKTKRVIRA
ncbi:MAG: AAA family ATPase [Luteolibacter sp.]